MIRELRRGAFHLNVVGRARTWFVVTGIVMLVSVASLTLRGINAGIDFRGGSAFTAEITRRGASVQKVRDSLAASGITDATVQKVGSHEMLVQTRHLSAKEQDRAAAAIVRVTGGRPSDVNVTDVGPKWGQQITAKAVRALVIFFVIVTVYLAVRLEPKMAGAAFVALVHDLLVTAGVYSLTGIEVTPATVIALLTILGYSLYDTVVIFDRVKERTAQLSAAGRTTYSAAANDALNQVLVRSINTSATALLPVGSLLFVGSFLLGAQTLRELALALFIGIIAGTYSSIFVATPLLASWKEREPRWAQLRVRIAARGQEAMAVPPPAPRLAPSSSGPAPAPAPHDVAVVAASAVSGAPAPSRPLPAPPRAPRRRKKRKRRKR